MISPSVITSKAAQNHFNDVVAQHADIVTGIANQAAKVVNYNAQKASELQARNDMQAEMAKEKMASDSAAKKTALDFASKQGELDIKRAALNLK